MVQFTPFLDTGKVNDPALHKNPEEKPRILVVTSCATRAMDLAGGLSAHHQSVSTATTFDELKARCNNVSLIVMELTIIDADGIEIIRHLGQQISLPELIFMSDFEPRIVAAASRVADSKGLTVRKVLGANASTSELAECVLKPSAATAPKKRSSVVLTDPQHIRRGVINDEFIINFQPKIDVQTLELVSVEALVRWRHPNYGLLSPESFVPLAERTGLINPLTDIIIDKAFDHAKGWRALGIPLKVAINISGASLADLSLPDRLVATAQRFLLPPEHIVVEITESWVTANFIDALDILTRLRMKGFHLSIDDFGTGYSSMLKLKQIPFSELKLDQSIIRGAANDSDSRSIVETSIDLGQRLGLHLVAEGIEHQDDWDLISELGCNEGQGYFIARPMSAEELPPWHDHWNLSLGVTPASAQTQERS